VDDYLTPSGPGAITMYDDINDFNKYINHPGLQLDYVFKFSGIDTTSSLTLYAREGVFVQLCTLNQANAGKIDGFKIIWGTDPAEQMTIPVALRPDPNHDRKPTEPLENETNYELHIQVVKNILRFWLRPYLDRNSTTTGFLWIEIFDSAQEKKSIPSAPSVVTITTAGPGALGLKLVSASEYSDGDAS
jgi:hypothetical protein